MYNGCFEFVRKNIGYVVNIDIRTFNKAYNKPFHQSRC